MGPSVQRGSGSRSNSAHLCTPGQAASRRCTSSWKPASAWRTSPISPRVDQDSTSQSGSGTLVTK